MPIDDPVEVKEQYACEDNLRARQALWQGATGTDPRRSSGGRSRSGSQSACSRSAAVRASSPSGSSPSSEQT